MKLVLNPDEVASMLDVDRRTVYRMMRRNEFPDGAVLRAVRPVRFSRAVIEAWINGRDVPAHAPVPIEEYDDEDDD